MAVTGVAYGALLLLLNVTGLLAANFFGTMVFMDTVGTAMAGLAYGIWAGIAVGLTTNLLVSLFWEEYRSYLYFAPLNVGCGLVWGLAGQQWPISFQTESQIVIYILTLGAIVGLFSTIYSVFARVILKFESAHLFDNVIKHFAAEDNQLFRFVKIFISEFLLSNFLDKTISTTVAVMFVLEIVQGANGASRPDNIRQTYHDLIELLAALYYVALGIAVKKLRVQMPTNSLVELLGPLGFFSVLIGLPILFVTIGLH